MLAKNAISVIRILNFLDLKLHESNQFGVRIFWHYSLIFLKSNTSDNSNHGRGITEKPELVTPGDSVSGVAGSKPGLFRTPISGGVHSATSAHDLPPPALAVRNLMEQVRLYCYMILNLPNMDFLVYHFSHCLWFEMKARFAHLCTVMSRMHHRRAFYPFGSLVDFAPDAMGRK